MKTDRERFIDDALVSLARQVGEFPDSPALDATLRDARDWLGRFYDLASEKAPEAIARYREALRHDAQAPS